jgi:hypothetical protein
VKNNISKKHDKSNKTFNHVKEEFTGKNLTRFGGSGLIRRFFKRYRIKHQIENRIKVEGRRKSKYNIGDMLISCLYGVFLGYPRPGHMEILSTDRVFQKLAGLACFPVQSTISRFLSSLKVSVARQIGSFNFDFLMKFRDHFKALKSITLDLDSHITTVYGAQQRSGVGYNPKKKGRKSYHPLLCFLGETRDYIGGLFRSGKHHTSYHAVEFLKSKIKKLPSHVEHIKLRADGGFFSGEMIEYLINKPIEFYIAAPIQPWIQNKIKYLHDWTDIGSGAETGQCEYVFKKEVILRMVFVRQKVKGQNAPKKQLKLLNTGEVTYDYQVIVTNNGIKEAADVWRFYNKRACCENFIKEGIYGFGLDKVVSHSYGGNYAWFELLMLAYNLMNFFKEEVLNQKKVKNTIQTIRDRLFFIPGKMVFTSRQWIVKLEKTWLYRTQYEEALGRL